MAEQIEFETPENVEVHYRLAGLGSRFVAWFTDQLLLLLAILALFLLLLVLSAGANTILDPLLRSTQGHPPNQHADPTLYLIGIALLISGIGSFFYYGLSELLMRGQTIGKRSMSIRVVKLDGFSLDAQSILIRSLFRVIDHIPALWIVPLVSKKSQRLGDMVAGTTVIVDRPKTLSPLRQEFAKRSVEDRVYRFDAAALRRARRQDIETVEKVLERLPDLPIGDRAALLERVARSLGNRIHVEAPAGPDNQARFLEDFLNAEFRRQSRQL